MFWAPDSHISLSYKQESTANDLTRLCTCELNWPETWELRSLTCSLISLPDSSHPSLCKTPGLSPSYQRALLCICREKESWGGLGRADKASLNWMISRWSNMMSPSPRCVSATRWSCITSWPKTTCRSTAWCSPALYWEHRTTTLWSTI